jgi:hypothetical protein
MVVAINDLAGKKKLFRLISQFPVERAANPPFDLLLL